MCRDDAERSWAELVTLLNQQLDSLEAQVYIAATDQELREFDERQLRIRDLQEELRNLKHAA